MKKINFRPKGAPTGQRARDTRVPTAAAGLLAAGTGFRTHAVEEVEHDTLEDSDGTNDEPNHAHVLDEDEQDDQAHSFAPVLDAVVVAYEKRHGHAHKVSDRRTSHLRTDLKERNNTQMKHKRGLRNQFVGRTIFFPCAYGPFKKKDPRSRAHNPLYLA